MFTSILRLSLSNVSNHDMVLLYIYIFFFTFTNVDLDNWVKLEVCVVSQSISPSMLSHISLFSISYGFYVGDQYLPPDN